jgi:hypothetical protein
MTPQVTKKSNIYDLTKRQLSDKNVLLVRLTLLKVLRSEPIDSCLLVLNRSACSGKQGAFFKHEEAYIQKLRPQPGPHPARISITLHLVFLVWESEVLDRCRSTYGRRISLLRYVVAQS